MSRPAAVAGFWLGLVLYALLIPPVAAHLDEIDKATLTEESERVGRIVRKFISAYGGADVIGGIRSHMARGRIRAFMRDDSGTYVRHFNRDRKLRVETTYSRSSELRILNGDRGVRGVNGDPPREVTGPRYVSMLYQHKYLDLPRALLDDEGYHITYLADEQVCGVNAAVLSINYHEGPPMHIYVDTERGFLVKTVGYFVVNGRRATLSAEFSDFRQVGDTVMPFRATNYASGMKIGETVIDVYELNPRIPENMFSVDIELPQVQGE